ncbi:MAG: hypothetical protein AAF638_00190 [Pseudomonadota bacterium]
MVLNILLFVLGLAVAALVAVLLLPHVANRAARLARQRLHGELPISLKDIAADRDELRAEFAVSARKLELEMEAVRERDGELRAEIGQHLGTIDDQALELAARGAKIGELEEQSEERRLRIEGLEEDLSTARMNIEEDESQIDALRDQLVQRETTIDGLNSEIDEHRLEIVALKTQSDNQRIIVAERNAEIERLNFEIDRETAALQQANDAIAILESKLEDDRARLGATEATLARVRADTENTLDRLRTENNELTGERRSMQARLTAQSAESLRQQKRSETLELKLSQAAEDLARMESRLKESTRLASADARTVTGTMDTIRAERDALQQSIRELKARVTARDNTLAERDRKIASLATALEDARRAAEQASAKRTNGNADIAATGSLQDFQRLKGEIARLTRERDTTKQAAKGDLASAHAEADKVRSVYGERIARLERELAEARGTMKAQRAASPSAVQRAEPVRAKKATARSNGRAAGTAGNADASKVLRSDVASLKKQLGIANGAAKAANGSDKASSIALLKEELAGQSASANGGAKGASADASDDTALSDKIRSIAAQLNTATGSAMPSKTAEPKRPAPVTVLDDVRPPVARTGGEQPAQRDTQGDAHGSPHGGGGDDTAGSGQSTLLDRIKGLKERAGA